MQKIYLLRKDKIMLGPFSLEKLQEKQLKPSDLVWYEGLPDWTPAGNLEQFKAGYIPTPTAQLEAKFSISKFVKQLFSWK